MRRVTVVLNKKGFPISSDVLFHVAVTYTWSLPNSDLGYWVHRSFGSPIKSIVNSSMYVLKHLRVKLFRIVLIKGKITKNSNYYIYTIK